MCVSDTVRFFVFLHPVKPSVRVNREEDFYGSLLPAGCGFSCRSRSFHGSRFPRFGRGLIVSGSRLGRRLIVPGCGSEMSGSRSGCGSVMSGGRRRRTGSVVMVMMFTAAQKCHSGTEKDIKDFFHVIPFFLKNKCDFR